MLGVILLIHDLSFLDRREGASQRFLFIAFALLSIAASLLTLLLTRGLWRRWTNTLRAQLQGRARSGLCPGRRRRACLGRALVRERERGQQEGRWSPQRLRGVLTEHLQESACSWSRTASPTSTTAPLPGACRSFTREWSRHRTRAGDARLFWCVDRAWRRQCRSRDGGCQEPSASPLNDPAYWLRRVWLSEAEEQGYYYGFANEGTLATVPSGTQPTRVSRQRLAAYREVNQRFADAVCDEAGVRRSDRAGAGLSLRTRSRDDPQAPTTRNDHYLLAHPLAQC